jgi:ParB-like chromosome segregation protein Spo0J
MDNLAIHEVCVADIKVGHRHRKDLGNIKSLADSIARLGLLQPIGITPDLELIFGARRIAAFKLCGRDLIPARVLDIQSLVQSEYDENDVRKDFTPSEKVAIARVIEKELEGRVGRPSKEITRLGEQFQKGASVDLAAKRVGFGSGDTLVRAKTVVDHGTPELIAAVDAGEVQIKSAATFAKQDATEQAQRIVAAGGNVKAAVIEFRKSLPSRDEARKIAAETGAAILGRDGRFHTDATDEERARGETYLRVAAALRTVRDLGIAPDDIASCVPSGSSTLFERLVDQTAEFLCSIQATWRSRHVA